MKRVIPLVLSFLISTQLFGLEIVKEFTFSKENLRLSEFNGYDVISIPGYGFTSEIGKPKLPEIGFNVLIPPGAEVTRIEIIDTESEILYGKYNIIPYQPPVPISKMGENIDFVEPDKEVYESSTSYPDKIAFCSGTGTMSGYRLAGIIIHPVQYIPKEGKLVFYSRIKLRIDYETQKVKIKAMPENKKNLFAKAVRGLVINPDDIARWAPPIRNSTGSRALPPGYYEYVLIVNSATDSAAFKPLIDWKHKKGLYTKIVSRQYLSNVGYSWDSLGIKNFIADAETTWGASWFFLAGDIDVLPTAKLRTGGNLTGEPVKADHYYADTDPITGTAGQPDYEDVFVGRASVNSARECSVYVNKTLRYEKNPGLDTQEKIFLPHYELWSGYQGSLGDTIARITPTPPWEDEIRKDWQSSMPTQELTDSLSSGIYFTAFSGHGTETGWGSSIAIYHSNTDADNMSNFPYLFFGNGICCLIGNFEYSDCYVEHLVNNANGGAIAFIGNSNYGWGDNTQYAEDLSEGLCAEVFRRIFGKKGPNLIDTIPAYHTAMVNFLSHNSKVPIAQSNDYCEFCLIELNLFGDPEIDLWTSYPQGLIVSHNSTVPTGPSTFTVTVNDNRRAIVQGARVCLMCKIDSLYMVDTTDSQGEVTFNINPQTVDDTMWVTVTKHNYLPYEGFALVTNVGISEGTDIAHGIKFYSVTPSITARSVRLNFEIPEPTSAEVRIYNEYGALVRKLTESKLSPGRHQMLIELKDDRNRALSSGTYFIKFAAGNAKRFEKVEKIILMDEVNPHSN